MQSTHYNDTLTNYLKQKNIKEASEHESSGKISPSKLTKPTLEAVLQMLGVPTDPPSDQSLRYFIRGNILEKIAQEAITFGRKTAKLQVEASYRNGVGFIDVYDSVPHEIKSAGAWTFKTVQKQGYPLIHHSLQAVWYALAKNKRTAWVHYINADTLQMLSFRVETSKFQPEVDHRTDLILNSLVSGNLPDYVALEPFHKSVKYSDYAMFFNKKGNEAENILKQYYPEYYNKLKKGLA